MMLGKYVQCEIYGKIHKKGIYSGYICSAKKHINTFIFSHSELTRNTISCVVIATAFCTDSNEIKYILAPSGDIFYQPEIEDLLSKVRNFSYTKLICLYEKSCGAVIFHRENCNTKVLLVKNHNGKYWSFPKGHVEKGETEHETAIREIKEETGLDVIIYDNYRQISDYVPFGNIKKRVVFFLAESKTDKVQIQHDEIDTYTWVSFPDAEKMCRYDNDLRILQTARKKIPKINNEIKHNSGKR